MNERSRKLFVYGSLVLAVCYGAYSFSGAKHTRSGVPSPTIEPLAAGPQAQPPQLSQRDVQLLQEADWGRDPFAQSRKQATGGPKLNWTLKGIVFNPSRPLAYINGLRVGIGDTVNSAKVIAIDKTKVTLTYQGTQFDVYVQKG